MAELLGDETVLVDVNHGPAAIASGLACASATLGCDVVVFVDVGGDVLAHGDEPGLASPLCDSVLLAAAVRMAEQQPPKVLGAVFGIGCDGELIPDEVLTRMPERQPGWPPPCTTRGTSTPPNDILHGLGVRTELDYERDASTSV